MLGARSRWAAILGESWVVTVAGLIFALLANFLSPRGLPLRAMPIQKATALPAAALASTDLQLPSQPLSGSVTSAVDLVSARLQAKGLTPAGSNQVYELYGDSRYGQGLVMFVDARQDPEYLEGHIPGAYLFDPYRADIHFGTVLMAGQNAEQIVIYCNGGDCEDSEHAALLLSQAGVPGPKLLVYSGGFEEWSTNGWPVEVGERRSGQLKENAQ
jgi:rhodanese-related sulfurtransferase